MIVYLNEMSLKNASTNWLKQSDYLKIDFILENMESNSSERIKTNGLDGGNGLKQFLVFNITLYTLQSCA